jgi:hypothetical protein
MAFARCRCEKAQEAGKLMIFKGFGQRSLALFLFSFFFLTVLPNNVRTVLIHVV